MTRRRVLRFAAGLPVAAWQLAAQQQPRLAPGTPDSAERMALITAMRSKMAAVRDRFEARTYTGSDGRKMPYRLFQPTRRSGKLPLILWLHGAAGLGNDNRKQIAGGNLFGSHVWALPEHQERVPCYVVAPQTSFGWIRYDAPRTPGGPRPKPVEGFGDGARMALEIVDVLRKEFAVDESRLYVMGNSMGGGGTWHMLAHKPGLFAAAIPVAGGATSDRVQPVAGTPLWNFHGDADKTVDVSVSRERIDSLRKAGGSPLYTEYPGVGHNANEWAFTEPALIEWLFHQKRRT